MPKVTISITATQARALTQKARRTAGGSLELEIRKAITQHLAGPRGVEAAFEKLLMEKTPKHLDRLLAQQKKDLKSLEEGVAWLRQRPTFAQAEKIFRRSAKRQRARTKRLKSDDEEGV